MTNHFRDNGGYIPGLALITNNLGRPEHMVRRKKKRRPIVKVEKHSDWGDGLGPWAWYCLACAFFDFHDTWQVAYHQATRHAHNHHGK